MKICLIVGHSLLKNGNYTSANGVINEYLYNKELVPLIEKYLKQLGSEVKLIICPERTFNSKDEEEPYKLNIVNNGSFDLVVELHLNSFNKVAKGTEVLYVSEKGKVYADRVQAKLATLFTNRGVKKRDNLYMLNSTKPVTIMIESFFCDNQSDCNIGKDKDRLAKLIAEGIVGKNVGITTPSTPPKNETVSTKNMTNQQFIEYVGRLATEDMKKTGILASLTVAQAIKESAWGKSELAQNANALFGIKHNSDWKGKVYNKDTGECYDGKNYVTINATFRAYDSWKHSINDHSVYLTTRKIGSKLRYEKVIGETDYKKACHAIKDAGYATGLNYAEGLIKLIDQHNLTRFDVKLNTTTPTTPTPTTPQLKYKVGDKVNYTSYYASSVSPIDNAVIKSGSGTITRVLTNGVRNPYLIDNGKIGWCNDGDISGYVGEVNNPNVPKPKFPYIVKIIANALNIRKEPNSDGTVVGQIKDKGKYTIVDEKNGYGKLKSGSGWIHLDFTERV